MNKSLFHNINNIIFYLAKVIKILKIVWFFGFNEQSVGEGRQCRRMRLMRRCGEGEDRGKVFVCFFVVHRREENG